MYTQFLHSILQISGTVYGYGYGLRNVLFFKQTSLSLGEQLLLKEAGKLLYVATT
jgi:hypothetical protein